MTTTPPNTATGTISGRIRELLAKHVPMTRNDLYDHLHRDFYPTDKWARNKALDAISNHLCLLKKQGHIENVERDGNTGALLWTARNKPGAASTPTDDAVPPADDQTVGQASTRPAAPAIETANAPQSVVDTAYLNEGKLGMPADPAHTLDVTQPTNQKPTGGAGWTKPEFTTRTAKTLSEKLSAECQKVGDHLQQVLTPRPDPIDSAKSELADLATQPPQTELELSLAMTLPNGAMVAFEYSGPADPEQLEAIRSCGIGALLPSPRKVA